MRSRMGRCTGATKTTASFSGGALRPVTINERLPPSRPQSDWRRKRSRPVLAFTVGIVLISGAIPGIGTTPLGAAGPRPSAGEEAIVRNLYPTATDVRVNHVAEGDVTAVRYKVRLAYPSTSVLEHYERLLTGLGWRRVAVAARAGPTWAWECFEDGTQPGTPLVHQFLAEWANPAGTRAIALVLSYRSDWRPRGPGSCGRGPGGDTQVVILQVMPLVKSAP
jgi:hypothetical protein